MTITYLQIEGLTPHEIWRMLNYLHTAAVLKSSGYYIGGRMNR